MRETRRDILLGPGLIAATCVALAFVSIGLFVRMAPAIRAILDENVQSQRAAVDILQAVSARRGLEIDETRLEVVRVALAKARGNITLEGEAAIVDSLEDAAVLASIGAEAGLSGLVEGARRLWELNEAAMQEADAAAARLGAAGAWTAAFGGLGVVIIALAAVVRLRRRIVVPIEDIERVLRGQSNGLHLIRCHPLPAASEIELIRSEVNALLDARQADVRAAAGDESGRKALRQGLVMALEALGRPAVIVHRDGRLVVGNQAGLALFGTDAGVALRDRVAAMLREGAVEPVAPEEGVHRGASVDALDGQVAAMVVVSPEPALGGPSGDAPPEAGPG